MKRDPTMKKCLNCNQTYEDAKKFCAKCGKPLEASKGSDIEITSKKEVFEDRLKAEPQNTGPLIDYAEFRELSREKCCSDDSRIKRCARTSYMRVYVNGTPDTALFDYRESRGAAAPREFLKGVSACSRKIKYPSAISRFSENTGND
jgi:Transposase IS66 family